MTNTERKSPNAETPQPKPITTEHLKLTLLPGVYSILVGESGIEGVVKIEDHDEVVIIFDKPVAPS